MGSRTVSVSKSRPSTISVASGSCRIGRFHQASSLPALQPHLGSAASINQAAQSLGCNPGNLHAQLTTLEQTVGAPLIHRHPEPAPSDRAHLSERT